jgi:hypothetical protein
VFQTPILFLIFNRPDTTKLVFESIKRIKPAKLYIAADGARKHKVGEDLLCKETRSIIDLIDWECEIKTLFRNENLGCKIAVSSAIDWFFENEEQGIILEDDCLPNESFYIYCETLLNYYASNERIMHISGNNFQDGNVRGNGSYYFSNYNHIWGWATWKRAWKAYNVDLSFLTETETETLIEKQFDTKKERLFWNNIFKKVINKTIGTWDYQWTYAVWKNNGLSILPNKNMIANIGFNNNGTHTSGVDILGLSNMKTFSISKIIHPTEIEINKKADKYGLDHYFNPSKFFYLYKKIIHTIKIKN